MSQKAGDVYVELGAKLDKLDKNLKQAENKTQKSAGRMEKGMSKAFMAIGGAMAAAFSTQAIINYTNEAVRLAGELQGVETAYKRVADPKLMERMKEATRGTVSELELMKAVTTASNFNLSLRSMPELLEFARRRAKDTGQEVDYLVNSIVTGIGRKSPLILDNLGISAVQLREKLGGVGLESASIAQLTEAVGDIAKEAYADFAEGAATAAEQQAKLNAQLEDTKAEIGQELIPIYSKWAELQLELIKGTKNIASGLGDLFKVSEWLKLSEENFARLEQGLGRTLTKVERATILGQGFNDVQKQLIYNNWQLTDSFDQLGKKLNQSFIGPFDEATDQVMLFRQSLGLGTPKEIDKTTESVSRLASTVSSLSNTPLGSILQGNELNGGTIDRETGMLSGMQIPEEEIKKFEYWNFLADQAQTLSSMLGQGFADALTSGENFGDVMADVLKRFTAQLIAAVAQAAILGALINAIPGLGTALGIAGGFTEILNGGGGFQLGGFLRGDDIYLSGERGSNSRNRR